MIVSKILKDKGRQVFTVTKETTVSQIASILAQKRIGAIVVIDQNGIVDGIISERDIVRGLAQFGVSVLEKPALDLMTRNVITRGLNADIDELMQEMTISRIRHLPIIDEGKLVGVISIGDVVKNRVVELEREGNMLRDYISRG
jgi:CBS domain-containing protein